MPSWDQVTKQVEKIVGKPVKELAIPAAVSKANTSQEKIGKEFDKARDQLEEKILAFQDSMSSYYNAVKMFKDRLDASDLGLDKKSPDYKSKRAECQKLIDSMMTPAMKAAQANVKNTEELDKHMRNLSGYKSPDGPDI